ncbi:unnamed protein product [Urochloa humidicola]
MKQAGSGYQDMKLGDDTALRAFVSSPTPLRRSHVAHGASSDLPRHAVFPFNLTGGSALLASCAVATSPAWQHSSMWKRKEKQLKQGAPMKHDVSSFALQG